MAIEDNSILMHIGGLHKNSLSNILNQDNNYDNLNGEIDLKEIGTIKRFYSVYGVYYVLLHFIQSSVITKCGFIPEKRS